MRLAAGLRPDPLGELKRSPRPPSHNKGGLLLREGEGRGGKGKGGNGERRGGEGDGEKEGEGRLASHTIFRPCQTLIPYAEPLQLLLTNADAHNIYYNYNHNTANTATMITVSQHHILTTCYHITLHSNCDSSTKICTNCCGIQYSVSVQYTISVQYLVL